MKYLLLTNQQKVQGCGGGKDNQERHDLMGFEDYPTGCFSATLSFESWVFGRFPANTFLQPGAGLNLIIACFHTYHEFWNK
ncbi:MAG: hypothetical protein A2X25_07185 [Chloroflexi bacterium GWB2_49_20]|nr:MAG: hypothetical protein A2X25_07185 [Chloroflexi bacterium GWB2_49_20]OGN77943.1 MAG: hypothetical protein A2X26_14990 [Chloroflexi bacterium GWC2_49_37]HBG74990.1 hypothetical protein [Anaerolineae bacterium]HCM97661.1 hypothetical protein [Anaerolineae bacterium]